MEAVAQLKKVPPKAHEAVILSHLFPLIWGLGITLRRGMGCVALWFQNLKP